MFIQPEELVDAVIKEAKPRERESINAEEVLRVTDELLSKGTLKFLGGVILPDVKNLGAHELDPVQFLSTSEIRVQLEKIRKSLRSKRAKADPVWAANLAKIESSCLSVLADRGENAVTWSYRKSRGATKKHG